jgi:hypothetical protein
MLRVNIPDFQHRNKKGWSARERTTMAGRRCKFQPAEFDKLIGGGSKYPMQIAMSSNLLGYFFVSKTRSLWVYVQFLRQRRIPAMLRRPVKKELLGY